MERESRSAFATREATDGITVNARRVKGEKSYSGCLQGPVFSLKRIRARDDSRGLAEPSATHSKCAGSCEKTEARNMASNHLEF